MATVHLHRAVIKQLTDQWLIWSCSQVSELITVQEAEGYEDLTASDRGPQCSGPYVITALLVLEVLCCSGLT